MQYLCCRVGTEWYGVEVSRVIEVLHFAALHEVPGAKPDVLGLLTLRDLIMPVIDLRLRFGLDGDHPSTLEEVGRKFGLTRERIRQIEGKALRRLRHPRRARLLREYL